MRIADHASATDAFDIYWARAAGLSVKRVKLKNGSLDFSGGWSTVGVSHSDPTDVAFSHATGSILYAANDGGIEKSPDNGVTWNRTGTASNRYDALQVYDVKVVLSSNSLAQNDVYFGTQDNDLFASSDSASTWPGLAVPEGGRFQGPILKGSGSYTQVHFNDQGPQVYGALFANNAYITFPFNQIDTVYALPGGGFFSFANDGGGNTAIWASSNGSTAWTKVAGLAISQSLDFYAIVTGPASNPSLVIPFHSAGNSGLVRVDNAFDGKANNESVTPLPLPSGAAVGNYGEQWLPSIRSFGVDPQDPNFIILPDVANNRMFITSDGGTTWNTRDDLLSLITDNGAFKFSMPGSSRTNFELSNAQVSAITFDPQNSNRILIGTAEAGIVYSSDHGASWHKIDGSNRVPNVTSFAFLQTQSPGEAYASTWGRGLWTLSLDVSSGARGLPRPPRPLGPQSSPNAGAPFGAAIPQGIVPGDLAQASLRFREMLPRLEVTTVGRHLPLHVVVSGQPIEVRGYHWKSVLEPRQLQIFIDGKPVKVAAMQISSDGGFVARIPGTPVPKKHVLEVREYSGTDEVATSSLAFAAVPVDANDARDIR